ncbi:delta-like protein A isoform X4 [Pomacea canaliculata]|uniref:delta-like protein A isoform X3 n=1 Tax=Pomacea canaliculata TaxID=400727 RepID=UPI000D727126|nr:delta-like protein A isoform X3 [Pomacea canaliculata]XP_025104342.1 delta-like protein A isoform X4 [Pomacea canaliculata]
MSSFNSSDPCLPSPCQNGGRCVNIGLYYFCDCNPSFRGYRCQFGGDFCASSPCHNGGICHSLSSNYFCSCRSGHEGINCDIPLLCASSPCQNGGTCQSLSSSYWCSCRTGYNGDRCEIPDKSQNWQEDFMTTTPTPTSITDPNTSKGASPVWIFPVIALIVSIIIIITVVCSLTIAKKRKKRQVDQQLRLGPPDTIVRSISSNLHSDTRVGNLTSVSDHPMSPQPYSVRYATRHFQTGTFVIEVLSESSHLSPQQPHLHDNEESRLDGGPVNHHVRDLPPSYLSVVTDPRYIRENGDSVQQLPSYDDVVAVIRQTKAPSDSPVTSTR